MWKLINTTYLLAILIATVMVFNIPSMALAESDHASKPGPPQPKGGIATVVGVDQPDNCLRIRSGPGSQYDVIGCANMGDQLKITGVWTSNDWAQLEDNGWVYGEQISTDLRPPRTAYSTTPTYVVSEEVVPDYDDWAYLPAYGYNTYWYGDVPIFFYNVAVWRWCHPWWWWHGLQAWWWQGGFHGRRHWNNHSFRNFATTRGVNLAAAQRTNISALNRMGRTTRSASIGSPNLRRFNANRSNITSPNLRRFNANRSNITSPNLRRFNANRSNITSPNLRRFNANRSNITSPNLNRFNTNRFRTRTNTFRSRTFSNPSRFRSGSANAFRSRSFSTPRSFSSGSIGGRHFGGVAGSGGISAPHIGGGGLHGMGGGRRHR
jgi:Bacterial SH3 domain